MSKINPEQDRLKVNLTETPAEKAEEPNNTKPKKTRKDYNRAYYEKTREKQLADARARYQNVKEDKNKKKKERYHNNLEESRRYYREYTRARRARQKAEKEAIKNTDTH